VGGIVICRILALGLLAWCVSAPAYSQEESKQPWDEYEKKIKAGQEIAAFGPDLFGDTVNLSNGALSFSATDVSLPGNSRLPVEFKRTLNITNRKGYRYNDAPLTDWDLDVPRISGVFQSGAGFASACAATTAIAARPPPVTVSGAQFAAQEYWNGNQAEMPYGGEMLLVNASAPKPTSGGPYYWMTSNFTFFSCYQINNGTAEGFLAVAPDGTRYWFDWRASYYEPSMDKVAATSGQTGEGNTARLQVVATLARARTVLYATRVEDRFGNWVTYSYADTNGGPAQLTRIEGSDGRLITIGYNAQGKVTTVAAGARTWNYEYVYPTPDKGSLSSVVLPDSSRWTLSLAALSDRAIRYYNVSGEPVRNCADPGDVSTAGASGTITHPSGAIGEFSVAPTRHGRSNVPKVCDGYTAPYNIDNDDIAVYAVNFDALSLTKKKVSGPGLTPMEWNYAYSADIWFSPGTGPVCTSGDCMAPTCQADACAGSSKTYVWGPNNEFKRYTYGNSYRYNEGKLLKIETGTSTQPLVITATPTILRTDTTAYELAQSGQPYQTPIGISPQEKGAGFTSEYLRPQVSAVTVQDGVNFTSQVELDCTGTGLRCFDAYARPTRKRDFSSLGYTRTQITGYADNLSAWVVGQVASVADVSTGKVINQTDYDTTYALPIRTYSFGKLQYTLTYDATSPIASGQRGTLATAKDGNNNITTLSAWKRGIPQSIQHPATPEAPSGAIESAVVNDDGTIASTSDENGYKTCYGYDVMGRMASITYPSETLDAVCNDDKWNTTQQAFAPVTTAEYGLPAGHWKQTVSTGNARKITYFDAFWRPLVSEAFDTADAANTRSIAVKRYDASGHLSFQSYPRTGLGSYTDTLTGTSTSYDALDRVTQSRQDSELGTQLTTTTEYLAGFQTRVTNPRQQQTTSGYQVFDQPSYERLAWTTRPEGQVVEVPRDVFGKPNYVRQRSADNSLVVDRRFVYDSYQRLCKTIEPETNATVMDYDAAGNLLWSASGTPLLNANSCDTDYGWGSGRRVDRTYDARNRLTALTFPDSQGNQTWSYSPDGLVKQINTLNDGITVANAYTYNRRRLLTGEAFSQDWYTWSMGYGYDRNGNVGASVTYPGNLTVDYAPNALGQATKAGTFASNVNYYPNGAIKQFTYGNGIVHTMTQNARQLPARSSETGGVIDHEYAYDENGNVASIVDHAQGSSYDRSMAYDGLDRLTLAGSASFGGDHWHRFTYDALDNIRSWKLAGVKDYANYYYDTASNRLTNIQDSNGASIVGLGYDVQGNLQNKNGEAYVFDYGNRLRSVTGKETYRYDGYGRRVQSSRTATGTKDLFAYSSTGLFMQDWSDRKNSRTSYVYLSNSLLAKYEVTLGTYAVKVRYQHTDALGSPVAETDEAGTVVERTQFEPYGAAINKAVDGVGYTGHVMDAATGLTYMQQRYYDPGIGRMLSVDPVTADPNTGANFGRYVYANNNPYKFTDPDGRFPRIGDSCNLDWCRQQSGGKFGDVGFGGGGPSKANKITDAAPVYASRNEAFEAGDNLVTEAYGGKFMRFMFNSDMVVVEPVKGGYSYKVTPLTLGVGPDVGRGKFLPRKPGSLGAFKGTDALRAENRVVRDAVKAAGLNKDQARRLHDEVSGQGLNYKEIVDAAKRIFSGE
jgi:RHS repeat-associated protein